MEKLEKEFIKQINSFNKKRNSLSHSLWHEEEDDDLVELLLSMLSNQSGPKYESFSEELSMLSKLIAEVSEAIEEDVLSESEAETVIKYMFSAFLSRRLDNVVNNLFTRPHSNWFLAAKREFYEERGRE